MAKRDSGSARPYQRGSTRQLSGRVRGRCLVSDDGAVREQRLRANPACPYQQLYPPSLCGKHTLFCEAVFPDSGSKVPCSCLQGKCCRIQQMRGIRRRLAVNRHPELGNFPVFSLLTGKHAETGSPLTAPTATQSCLQDAVSVSHENPRLSRDFVRHGSSQAHLL